MAYKLGTIAEKTLRREIAIVVALVVAILKIALAVVRPRRLSAERHASIVATILAGLFKF